MENLYEVNLEKHDLSSDLDEIDYNEQTINDDLYSQDDQTEDENDDIDNEKIDDMNDIDDEDLIEIEDTGISDDTYMILKQYLTKEQLDNFNKSNEDAIRLLKSTPDLNEYAYEILWNDLAERNMNLVYKLANDCTQRFIIRDLQELISAGMLGFAKAFKAYDPDKINNSGKPNKFATFAYHCIKNEIRFAVRKESKHYKNDESINNVKYTDKNGNNLTIEELIKDPKPTVAEQESTDALKALIRKMLNYLSPLEKYVMWARYGLDGEEMTQKDIAKIVDMSQANISKIERNCLDRLKIYMDKANAF